MGGAAPAAAAPANDDFSAAAALAGSLPIVVESDNLGATEQPGEPSHAGNYGGASVWYRWTPSESGPVAIHTCSNLFDSLLAAYTGTTLEDLVEVASGDDGCGSGLGSRIDLQATAGLPMLIAVDGYGDREGPLTLTVTAQIRPRNDDFAAAEVLDGPLPRPAPRRRCGSSRRSRSTRARASRRSRAFSPTKAAAAPAAG